MVVLLMRIHYMLHFFFASETLSTKASANFSTIPFSIIRGLRDTPLTDSTLLSTNQTFRRLWEVSAEGQWQWPSGSSLTIGEGDPAFSLVTVRASMPYRSLTIKLPSPHCSKIVTFVAEVSEAIPETGFLFTPVAHIHDHHRFDISIALQTETHARLFLGPSLQDGYEILLGAGDPWNHTAIRKMDGTLSTVAPRLLNGQSTETKLWLTYMIVNRVGSLRLGIGSTVGHSEVLRLDDLHPPITALVDNYLWVISAKSAWKNVSYNASINTTTYLLRKNASWKVCLEGLPRSAFSMEDHALPLIKLVEAGTSRAECFTEYWDVPLLDTSNGATGSEGGPASIWPLQLHVHESSLTSHGQSFKFMHGGMYELCYKPNARNDCVCSAGSCHCVDDHSPCTPSSRKHGSCNPFAGLSTSYQNNILFAQLRVLGIRSECKFDDCLQQERWNCYMSLLSDPDGVCRFDFTVSTGRIGWTITHGPVSRMTWTSAWFLDSLSDGQIMEVHPQECIGDSPAPQFDVQSIELAHASFELLPTEQGIVNMPKIKSQVRDAFTVTVCYCPSLATRNPSAELQQVEPELDGSNPCSSSEDYVQNFGMLLMWTFQICDIGTYRDCPFPYLRAIPQQKFVGKLKCPPGGVCTNTLENRIKYLDAGLSHIERPNWDLGQICRTERLESDHAIWPSISMGLNLPGGDRADYRAWWAEQVFIDATTNQPFDVCYCDSNCTELTNWFQVGRIRTSLTFNFAAWTGSYSADRMGTLEFVNKPGAFSLYGGLISPRDQPFVSPFDSNKFSGRALLNIMSFDRDTRRDGLTTEQRYGFETKGRAGLQIAMDAECQLEEYSSTLTEGLRNRDEAYERVGYVPPETTSFYLHFSGLNNDQTVVVKKAGTIAICYCARVIPGGSYCLGRQHWFFAGLLQIRGPRGSQLWIFPTKTVVSIDGVQGWGFTSSDRLKLLDNGKLCDDDADQAWLPDGSTLFQVTCSSGPPSNSTCQTAAVSQEIQVIISDSDTTGIHITQVRVENLHSTMLTFNGPITDHLQEGDAITLNPEHIMIDGNILANMTDTQLYNAFLLAGKAYFRDDTSRSYFSYWHRVRYIEDGSANAAGVVRTKLRIPLGWDDLHSGGVPAFSIVPTPVIASEDGNPEAQWAQRNRMGTALHLRAPDVAQSLKLCWAPLDVGGVRRTYGDAGEVTFVDPETMRSTELSMAARSATATAPAIVMFSTNRESTDIASTHGEMYLTLRFLSVSAFTFATAHGIPVLKDSWVGVGDATQASCGGIFLEVWSNDPQGFPVPKLCFWSNEGSTGIAGEREVTMVFERFSGIRNRCGSELAYCEYQFVLNVIANSVVSSDHVMDLYLGCRFEGGGCKTRFEIFEMGPVRASRTSASAGPEHARLAEFELQDVDSNGVQELSSSASRIQGRIRGLGTGIVKSSFLRIYLLPLTQWNVGSVCSARCIPSAGTTCSEDIECTSEYILLTQLLGSARSYNVIKLRLPADMTTIAGSVAHTIQLGQLSKPEGAIFPTRLSVEMSSPDDGLPSHRMTIGHIAILGASSSAAEGRLLVTGRSGSGTSPFQAQVNILYMRLMFKATLWGGASINQFTFASTRTAHLEILLPEGYTCSVKNHGLVPHRFDGKTTFSDYELMAERDAPYDNEASTLFMLDRDLDDFPDYPRSSLFAGSWDLSVGRNCTYTLEPTQALFAGQVFYVELVVANPFTPLQQTSLDNVWRVRLLGRGSLNYGDMYSTDFFPFSAEGAEADLWASNAAVLAPLQDVLVQPSDFSLGAYQFLSIFFQTSQSVDVGGEVLVVGPGSFIFDQACIVSDLEDFYYEPVSERILQTLRLRGKGSCHGIRSAMAAKYSTNSIRFKVQSRMEAGRTYAFRADVLNPLVMPQVEESWYVWTLDSHGFMVDGSQSAAALAIGLDQSWQLYYNAWPRSPSMYIESHALRPKDIFGVFEVLTVSNINVTGTMPIHTSLRVIAPLGCSFVDPFHVVFMLLSNTSTLLLPHVPLVTNSDQLTWPSLILESGEAYGFRAPISVSLASPRVAARSFFLELGYEQIGVTRVGATTVRAPSLRELAGASLDYISSRTGYRRNVLTFEFRTATDVPPGEDAALLIEGNEGLRGSSLFCEARSVPGYSSPLPSDCKCIAGHDSFSSPFLKLSPSSLPIKAGFYALQIQASNPVSAIGSSGNWTLRSVANISNILSSVPLDAPVTFQSFIVTGPMLSASLASHLLSSVDYRPGRMNFVLFALRFSLSAGSQPSISTLRIHAPRGYKFEEDCSDSTEVRLSNILASGSIYFQNFSSWPIQSLPLACKGVENKATLSVPRGLSRSETYLLRMSVTNPLQVPLLNFWTLEYDLESSEPLLGYPLSIITFLLPIEPINLAATNTVVAPVIFTFRVEQTVPIGGVLRVRPPASFDLSNATELIPQDESLRSVSRMLVDPSKQGQDLLIRLSEFEVLSRTPYILRVLVSNPETMIQGASVLWYLASFDHEGAPLDEGSIEGFSLLEPAFLSIVNVGNRFRSLEKVSLRVFIRLSRPALFGDTVTVSAPSGISLVGTQPPLCNGFSWNIWASKADIPVVSCTCTFGPCQASYSFSASWLVQRELEGIAYTANVPMEFALGSANPASHPSIEQSFWRLAHSTLVGGSLAAVGYIAVETWQVIPQIQQLSVMLIGSSHAAGAESSILLEFVPSGNADAVWLAADYPREFSFDNAYVEAPRQKDKRSSGNNLYVSSMSAVVGFLSSLTIEAVTLGRGGGQTSFSLTTYTTDLFRIRVDESLNFEGFFQSGRATLQTSLQGVYATDPARYPARSELAARSDEQAKGIFTITFSFRVLVGDHLVLNCEGSGAYVLIKDGRMSLERSESNGESRQSIMFEVQSSSEHRIDLMLVGPEESIFKPGQIGELIVWMVPTLGINTWRIETYEGSKRTNTNDGESAGFAPVAQLDFLIQAPRPPPFTIVTVDLAVNIRTNTEATSEAPVSPELRIIPPLGFTFPEDCGTICTYRGLSFAQTGRAMVSLISQTSTTLLGIDLQFRVVTPRRTPSEITWLVEARGLGGQVVGWGAQRGFKVDQMLDTVAMYGSIQGLANAQLAFVFTFSLEPGERFFSVIEVLAPDSYFLSCLGSDLNSLSLPGGPPSCDTRGFGQLKMSLNETLRPGAYAFTVKLSLGMEVPEPNEFALIIRERTTEIVVDAAFELLGKPFAPLPVTQPSLAWSTAGFGQLSSVTVGFTFTNFTFALRALLISLPLGFEHSVRRASDVKSSNAMLPLMKGRSDWIDATTPSRLRILLEPADHEIAEGSYRLTFPARVPETAPLLPRWNLWTLSLCSERTDCFGPTDLSVIISFPMAGFHPWEVSYLEQKRTQTALDTRAEDGGPSVSQSYQPKSLLGIRWFLPIVLASCLQICQP